MLLIQPSQNSSAFDFVNDCMDIFIKLDSATKEFELIVETERNKELLQLAVKDYTNEIVLYSMNRLNKHTKSENELIQHVSIDLTNALSNLVQLNYGYLNFVTNANYSKKELKQKGLETLSKLKTESGRFIDISTGICMVTVDESKKPENQKQYLLLTLEQKNGLITKMENYFGDLETQNKPESTHFEKSAAIFYHFLNLNSECSTN